MPARHDITGVWSTIVDTIVPVRMPARSNPDTAWLACPAGFSGRFWRLATSFLPSPVDTALLRATLLSGAPAQASWADWSRAVRDPLGTLSTDSRHLKVLIPFVARQLRANGIDPGAAFNTYARAAHLTESLRTKVYLRESGRVLDHLAAHRIGHVVLKGAALAESLYLDPALRRADDLDILVLDQEAPRAFDVLRRDGFVPIDADVGSGSHHLPRLHNPIGLAVELHSRPASLCREFDAAGMERRSVAATVAGRATRVPCRSDSLSLAAVHAVGCTSSANLRWVCDTWLLANLMNEADWDILLEVATTSGLALPLSITLGYVADAIGPVVPTPVLARLRAEASRTSQQGRSAVVFGARCSLPTDLRGILQMPGGWRPRLEQLAWRALPPPRHVRWAYGLTRGWQVGLRYPYRLLSLGKQLTGFTRGPAGL